MRIGWLSRLTFTAAAIVVPAFAAAEADIAAFWRGTLDRLAREPLEATERDLRETLPYRVFAVEYRSLGGVRVRARLALPIRGGGGDSAGQSPLPAIVTVPGYGGNQHGVMLAECQRGYAILQVDPRSQGASAELWKIDPGAEKLTWHIEKPEGAYYQLAYADVIRGVDYLAQHSAIDRNRIAIAGTSQGGGIALAVAALDPRLKAVTAHVPFLCDMRGAARTQGSLVKRLLDQSHVNDEAHLSTLDYFDPLQLVPSLRAPALLSSGGQDTVCPAATIRAVFDRIPSAKSLLHEPTLTHTTSASFYRMTWLWLDQFLRP